MLDSETREEIGAMVRSGFYDRLRLMEIFAEERYGPGELDRNDVLSAIDASFAEYEREKLTFPTTTDCDRLDTAFAKMNERGVIALQNAGHSQSDGFDDVCDVYSQHPNKESILGYCFYHGQDLDRAIVGDGLYLAFGPIDPDADQTVVGIEVGNAIREELENAGLTVDWNGTYEKRLSLPKLHWQKR